MVNSENEAREDLKSDRVGGLIKLDSYKGSSLPLDRFKITRVLDDILMVQYADTETGEEIKRDGIFIPHQVLERNQVWRVGRVILAGPQATIKPGETIVFPNDKGIPVARMGDLRNLVFLNEERIFGVVEPI